jgi:hypothetical protein
MDFSRQLAARSGNIIAACLAYCRYQPGLHQHVPE